MLTIINNHMLYLAYRESGMEMNGRDLFDIFCGIIGVSSLVYSIAQKSATIIIQENDKKNFERLEDVHKRSCSKCEASHNDHIKSLKAKNSSKK